MTEDPEDCRPKAHGPRDYRLAPTPELMRLAQAGDERAANEFAGRVRSMLKRRMHGKLPRWARYRGDTSDLVQSTMIRALRGLPVFIPIGDWAFFAYAYQIAHRRMLNEIRNARSRGVHEEFQDSLASPDRSPSDDAELAEFLDRYWTALHSLTAREQTAVILRLQEGWGYGEIARRVGSRTFDAARMLIQRASLTLAKLMGGDGHEAR